MKQYAAIDDVVYFWFAGNDTSGSGGDGASPAADVRLAGAAADAIPTYSPTPVLLSHANYPAGAYEISITASAANGFAAGNAYAVFCTLAIDSQNPTGFVGSFDTKPVESNPTQIGDSAQSLTDLKDFADAGYDPNTNKITGTADMVGTDNAALATALVTVDTVVDTIQADLSNATDGLGALKALIDTVDGVVDTILVDTADLQGNQGAWATAVGFSTHSAANVWAVATRVLTASTNFNDLNAAAVKAEVVAALADIKLDHLLNIAVDTNWATTVHLDSVLGHMADVGTAASFSRDTDSLEAIRNQGDSAWVTGAGASGVLVDTTVAAVTDQTHFTLTAGSDIDDAYKDQAIVLYDASNGDFPSVRKVSAYTGATKTVTLDSAPDFTFVPGDGSKIFVTAPGTTAPTAGQCADAVWDEVKVDHTDPLTFGGQNSFVNG